MKRIGCKEAHLNLHSQDGMDSLSLLNGIGADLAQADAADFSFFDEFGQRCDGSFDGNIGIYPRTFEDVDSLDAT